eukprot:XP_001708337.1 Hypothetical protein GL50803_20900 [Giardia lamblia ATCC 50803]
MFQFFEFILSMRLWLGERYVKCDVWVWFIKHIVRQDLGPEATASQKAFNEPRHEHRGKRPAVVGGIGRIVFQNWPLVDKVVLQILCCWLFNVCCRLPKKNGPHGLLKIVKNRVRSCKLANGVLGL